MKLSCILQSYVTGHEGEILSAPKEVFVKNKPIDHASYMLELEKASENGFLYQELPFSACESVICNGLKTTPEDFKDVTVGCYLVLSCNEVGQTIYSEDSVDLLGDEKMLFVITPGFMTIFGVVANEYGTHYLKFMSVSDVDEKFLVI